jgi:hypothetical protein
MAKDRDRGSRQDSVARTSSHRGDPECYPILRIDRLLTQHVFPGMLLLGPVTLKAGSVIDRSARYYTASEPYRRRGHPRRRCG